MISYRQILALIFLAMLSLGRAAATDLPFTETFEGSNGGFTVTGSTSWKWGKPTSGPGAAHSGSKVWGTNLLGDYGNNEIGVLTSQTYDLSTAAGKAIVVRWWQYLVTETGFDYGLVEVSKNGGGTWETVIGPRSGEVNAVWTEQTVLLDESYAVADFQIRFTLTSDGMTAAAGFYMDDLRLVAVALANADPARPLQNFENGDAGFVAAGAESSWSFGTPSSGPGTAHSGNNAWGTNLAGLYNANETSTLTSPAYNLSSAVGKAIVVTWWQFIETEEDFDTAAVEVSKDGGATWSTPNSPVSGEISPNGWIRAQVFLDSNYAVPSFVFRFVLKTDASFQFTGIYIDDADVRAVSGLLPTADSFSISTPQNIKLNLPRALFAAKYHDPTGSSLKAVSLGSPLQLPAHGTLLKGDQPISAGVSIDASELDSLSYMPEADYNGPDSFQWTSRNDFGATSTSTVSINVLFPAGPVVITTQPVAQTVNPGARNVTFQVIATGEQPLSYQWRKNQNDIFGKTEAMIVIDVASETDEATYDVVVTNGFNGGSSLMSEMVALNVNDSVRITVSPVSKSVNEGTDATFLVTAEGTGPLSYQWEKDNLSIPNETSPTLSVLKATAASVGSYRCVVTNVVNNGIDFAPARSDAALLSVQLAPIVLVPPKSMGVQLNGTVRFSVSASGPNLTYQWLKDDLEIPGAGNSTLILPRVVAASAGRYSVRISNPVSSVTSDAGELRIVSWKDLAGTYQAVLTHDNSAAPAEPLYPGRVTMTITSTGMVTGKLEYEGQTHALSGKFNSELTFNRRIARRSRTPVMLQLKLDSLLRIITADVSHSLPGGTFHSNALLFASQYRPSRPAPQVGRYTMRFSSNEVPPVSPDAPGFATVLVTNSGFVRFAGRLPDGTPFTTGAFVHADGGVAWYAALYRGLYRDSQGRVRILRYGGSLASPLTVNRDGGLSAVTGVVEWRKPRIPVARFWPDGGNALLNIEGSFYRPPARNHPVLDSPLGSNSFNLMLRGPVPNGQTSRALHLTADNKFLFVLGHPENIQLTVNRQTGLVTGFFNDFATRKKRFLRGVVLQAQMEVWGLFLGNSAVGEFTVTPVIP